MAADLEALKIDRGAGARPRRRRRSRWPMRVAGLALLAALVWLFQRPILALVDRLRLPEVRVARVVRRDPGSAAAVSGTAANGYVVARKSAALSSDFPARLIEMRVVEGSVVKEGEVVARLFSDELAAAVERAEAELELARASQARAGAQLEAAQRALPRLEAQAQAADDDVVDAEAQERFARLDHERVLDLVADGTLNVSRQDETERNLASAGARLAAARARAASAKAALAEGRQQVAVAEAAVAESQAGVRAAEAAVAQAEASLDKSVIRAPFDGVVVQKEAEIGEVVSPNSQGGGSLTRGSVATMVDLDSLEVQADVPEKTLSAVTVGNPAMIYLDAFPGEPYAGRIDRIWPVADRQKATVEVRVAFERRDDKLRPEMGVRVVFLDRPEELAPRETTPSEPVLLVPAESVVRVDGESGVFVVERDVVRYQPLRLGEERAGRVAALEGLRGDELVVLSPPAKLASGDRVRVGE